MSTPEPLERVPDRSWEEREPPFLVPVPARLEQPLTGKRLVWHVPSLPAWRYDLIGVDEADHRNDVGITDEADYYRAEREQAPGEAISVSIDYLWVEQVWWTWDEIPDELRPPAVAIPDGQPHLSAETWLEHTFRPPIRRMRAGFHIRGRIAIGTRAALREPAPDGSLQQGYRVISTPHLQCVDAPNMAYGLEHLDIPLYQQSITVCSDSDYFRWSATGELPRSARAHPLGAFLLE